MILRKLNLASRSVCCFGFFSLMILAIGLIALRQADLLNSAEKFIQTNVVSTVRLLDQLSEQFVEIRANNARARNPLEPQDRRTKALDDILQSRQLMTDYAQSLSKLIITPLGRKAFDEFMLAQNAYALIQDQYITLITLGQFQDAVELSSGKMKSSAEAVQGLVKTLTELNLAKAKKAGEDANAVFDQTVLVVGVFVAVGLTASLILALLYTRSLTVPIRDSLLIAERIASNNLGMDIILEGSDEAARMISALATMQTNLRATLILIGDSSTQLAATSEEMHAVTENASRTIQRQSHEIEMAATAVNEMSAAVEEVAGNATTTSQLTSHSSSAAMVGRTQVDDTITAINLMVSNVQATSTEVQALVVMAADISKVLDVIRAIAEQTNLLALNAAIEAARAGEAGRGFAVVADEVRALAHRTQQSTREIEQMVGSIQSGTTNAVSSMNQTNAQAQKTLVMAHGAGKALAEITNALDQINERNLLIATAAEEQSQVAQEVDRNLVSIRDLSSETSEASIQTAIATAELSTLATSLNLLTRQFRLD
jgi:methyl-accepting chemotaxis protein